MKDEEKFVAALDRMIQLSMLLDHDMAESFARDGLTSARVRVLWELQQLGPTTQRHLAEALQVSARNITGLVDGLESTGFVTREPHPTDRRATLVSFTEQGRRAAQALVDGQRDFANLLFAEMPRKRFEAFVEGLDEVLTRLSEAGLSQIPLKEE